MKKGLGDERLRAAIRKMDALMLFREAEDPHEMVQSWNDLYPAAQITLDELAALDAQERSRGAAALFPET